MLQYFFFSLLDWCPQYQNLAHVFKEISKLKDDDPGSANNAAAANLDQHVAQAAQLQPRQFPHFALKNPSLGKKKRSIFLPYCHTKAVLRLG